MISAIRKCRWNCGIHSKWNLLFNAGCHKVWQILNEWIRSTAVHLIKSRYGLESVNTSAGPNTIFWASKLRYKSTLNIRSFGGRGLNIFFSLIKAGISVRLSVCLHFYYVENRSSNRLHAWRVCCCGPKGVQCAFWCNIDTRHVQN